MCVFHKNINDYLLACLIAYLLGAIVFAVWNRWLQRSLCVTVSYAASTSVYMLLAKSCVLLYPLVAVNMYLVSATK